MLAAMKIGGTEVKEIVKIAKETGNYQVRVWLMQLQCAIKSN